MKKIVLLATVLFLVLSLAACSNGEDSFFDAVERKIALYNIVAQSQGQSQRVEKEFPSYDNQGRQDGNVTLHFLDGVNDLPYIEVDAMLALVNTSPAAVSKKGAVVTCVRHNAVYDVDTTLVIDFDLDTIRFEDYNLFMMKDGASTILDVTSLDFFDGEGKPRLIQKLAPKYLPRYGDPLEINLAKYGIDLVIRDGKYLLPLQTFSDIFIAPAYLSCLYFNGKSVICADDFSKQNPPLNEAVRNLYYQGERGERSAALAKFGYNELCMALDLLYGLKEQHGITSFDQLMQSQGAVSMSVSKSVAPSYSLKRYITESTALDADLAIYHLIGDFLDDNHAKWLNFSYLVGENDAYQPNGAARERLYDYEKIYKAARDAVYPIDPATGKSTALGYKVEGNTAFVTFDQFNTTATYADLDKYYEGAASALSDDDTIALIMKAHDAIVNDSSIKNVVIDLSANLGGAADTAVFVAAWFLGEATISMKHTSTGALCSTSYRCDANRDHKFDEDDTLKGKRLFCLVSPCSFSCGNLVPSLFRESEKVTLLGKTSGGGACVVQFLSSAWGTNFRISGPQCLCYMKNGSYYDIDQGARPDHSIEDPDFYYSNQRADLVAYINSLN